MTPDDLVRVFEGLSVKASEAQRDVQRGAREALRGVRVPGHRIAMSGSTVRVSGPQALVVAQRVAERAGQGAVAAVRGSVS